MDKQHPDIKRSLDAIENDHLYWPFPALSYLEEIQSHSSIKFTVGHLKKEIAASSNPAKSRWSAWLDRLDSIIQQEDYEWEKIGREGYYIWFYRLNYSLWSRLISHAYNAELSFRRNDQRNYIAGQANALDMVIEEEHQSRTEDKLRVIDEIVAYGNSLSTTLNT